MDKIKPQIGQVNANEVVLREHGEWLYFREPYRLITAERLADILPALREIEDLVRVNQWHAAGFLSYEAAPAFEAGLSFMRSSPPKQKLPYLWFGLYASPLAVTLPEPQMQNEAGDWSPTTDREAYHSAIATIKDHIAAGRSYQVNYTMRLRAEIPDQPWDFFLRLAQEQNRHAAFIDTGPYVICSASPELFFRLDGNTITCRPMKGTAPRGRTTSEDCEQSNWLRNSVKNRAENVMIVDMIRNDLGRIAEIGSVAVPQLFETERYPTLWQMTSTVTAKTHASIPEILTALFPCASITGAPKISTMKIIAELENTPREIYTGTIGYVAPDRKATFNVAIRTALLDRTNGYAEYGVGGGIVWDSESTEEHKEALLKAHVLTRRQRPFSLLETLLWTPEGGYFLLEKHMRRMLDSANYFDIPIARETLEEHLVKISAGFVLPQRVRLLVDPRGAVNLEFQSFSPASDGQAVKASLAKQPVHSKDVFLFHKTTQRDAYEAARQGLDDLDDVLLYNEKGELTEFTIGNLVVELDDQWYTPPIPCGVLAGTFRAHLLETNQVAERIIRVQELGHCTRIFRVNSIRGWQTVTIL